MGIGDSIGKAAENAVEDLAGTSKPAGETRVPDPTDPNDNVEVHSSLSEGSNAMKAEKEKAPGLKTGPAPGPVSENPFGGDAETEVDAGRSGTGQGRTAQDGDGTADSAATPASAPAGASPASASPASQGGVPGSGGLPESNPDELRADPSEGDRDPSTSTGRG